VNAFHAGPSILFKINSARHPDVEFVIPLENGIQVEGIGWTPVFTGVTKRPE
jgi:hypothetical protein